MQHTVLLLLLNKQRCQERNKTSTHGEGFQKTKGFHRFHLASAGVVLLHTGSEAGGVGPAVLLVIFLCPIRGVMCCEGCLCWNHFPTFYRQHEATTCKCYATNTPSNSDLEENGRNVGNLYTNQKIRLNLGLFTPIIWHQQIHKSILQQQPQQQHIIFTVCRPSTFHGTQNTLQWKRGPMISGPIWISQSQMWD